MEKKHVAKLIRHKEKIIRQLIDDLFWAAMGLALGFLFLLAVVGRKKWCMDYRSDIPDILTCRQDCIPISFLDIQTSW